ncbi:MAG: alpha/beta hydrolase [Candidatus Limnocylindrales bacterium]
MIRRLLAAGGAAALSVVTLRSASRRASQRLLDAPRVDPGEASLGPALDQLGGEVVRLRSRDGLRLSGRWLPAERSDGDWTPDPHDAILLLHGYTGSVAPDLVEYGPFLRRTAGVLGLDFRGHGESEAGPSTFGMLEVEDVAGALVWLGERGITRLALVGTSMGGMAAIASVAVLGDGSLVAADMDPARPRAAIATPRPAMVAVVADSTAPEIDIPVANRLPLPGRRFLAARLFDAAGRTLGADLRATEPVRVVGLVAPVPLLLIHGEADTTVPLADARRLVAAAGPTAEHWFVPGAEHSQAHAVASQDYERRVTDFLRVAFTHASSEDVDAFRASPIIAPPGVADGGPDAQSSAVED